MAAHSCAMGGPLLWWRCEVAEHDGDTPFRTACYAILDDPERTRRWPGGVRVDGSTPHFASVVPGTLPDVTSDDTPTPGADRTPDVPDVGMDSEIEAAEAAIREAKDRLAQTPVEQIIVTHVVGFYELAAIHLSANPPNLGEAAIAIDAMSAVVHTLEGRLGDDEPTMLDALQNIQFAFVQIKNQQGD